MKKISIAVLAFSGMLILDSCGTQKQATTEPTPAPIEELKPAELPENGIAIELMDKSVRPQDDFLQLCKRNLDEDCSDSCG